MSKVGQGVQGVLGVGCVILGLPGRKRRNKGFDSDTLSKNMFKTAEKLKFGQN